MGIDHKELDKLLKWFHKTDLASAEIEYNTDGSYKVIMSKGQVPSAVSLAQMPMQMPSTVSQTEHSADTSTKETTDDDANITNITAPIVGTFYRALSPDTPPFVQIGDRVKKGEVLCILEAMKVMNEFEAEFDMEIVSILVDNAVLVEFGQALFEVKEV